MAELGHQGQNRLPTTGEVVPLLQPEHAQPLGSTGPAGRTR
ncbi:hypothetical protein ACF07T_39710 [Streptomyces sp. NPDC015184]